jgi:cell division protein ZapA
MPKVSLTINGRAYEVSCDPGQEEHVASLGREIDRRVGQLADNVGQVGDNRLLLMAALLISDELETTRTAADDTAARAGEAETALAADQVERMARRVDAIAVRLGAP